MQIAISVGDLNGIGIELALRSHEQVSRIADPLYLLDRTMLEQAARKLGMEIPEGFRIRPPADSRPFTIRPGTVCAEAGAYSYASFKSAVDLARSGVAAGVCTLPIHKKAWEAAGVTYKGHTDALRSWFDAEAIMMLGCPQMYVGLYTEHIPLRQVADRIGREPLERFLLDFHRETGATRIGVLGLNPHAGDDGVLGDEESTIRKAIEGANQTLRRQGILPEGESLFEGPLVPDVAFTPAARSRYRYYAALYHDQGLIPLKALYFDESINVSLNLPILRSSVDHGTAFDIAYGGGSPDNRSYLNAVGYLARRASLIRR